MVYEAASDPDKVCRSRVVWRITWIVVSTRVWLDALSGLSSIGSGFGYASISEFTNFRGDVVEEDITTCISSTSLF